MNAPALIPTDRLPDLIDRAARALASAKDSAEVLDARDAARVAYDAAKTAGRMIRAKAAHDEVIGAVYRAQADALLIEARAKMRLADEYDAAQDRGEVAKDGRPKTVVEGNGFPMRFRSEFEDRAPYGPPAKIATAADLGLRRDEIHDARKLRDAERAEPGLTERALQSMVAAKQEPTRAELQRSVLAAVEDARQRPREDRRNPHHVPDAFRDRVLSFIDHCEQLAGMADEIDRIAAYADPRFPTTQTRMDENAREALTILSRFMEARNA